MISLNNISFFNKRVIVNSFNNYKRSFGTKSQNEESAIVDSNHSFAHTLNLPKTTFSMKANAATREPTLLKDPYKLYKWQLENNKGENWISHDGPPYANGDLHMGHALNKILKDIVNRYKVLKGFKVNYIPGWDCHGLPIEQQAFKKLKKSSDMKASDIRKIAGDFARKEIEKQSKGFQEMGILGDWENPYKTLDHGYEVEQIQTFYDMFNKGYIYRGVKPVHWSPSSRTALADAELEYNNNHTSKSIFVKFNVKSLSNHILNNLPTTASDINQTEKISAIIWTTTPWTIPANQAICVNSKMDYILVKPIESEQYRNEMFIISKERLESLTKSFNIGELKVILEFKGEQLKGTITKHPQYDRESPIITGDHVIEGSGTGLVHTAPGHGVEDFQICQQQYPDIKILSPVNDLGCFTDEVGEKFVGLEVLGDGNEAVINDLETIGSLVHKEDYIHKYPYDWRTKKPIIIRTTLQWFVGLKNVQKTALQSIERVNMVPPSGSNRLSSMIGKRTDWCISRQRVWGCPIPVFYNCKTNEPLINDESINHIKELFGKFGSDCWFEMSTQQLLPPSLKDQHENFVKGIDTMDVWFDSGTSWRGVLVDRGIIDKDTGRADIYLEGSDQHRGWFQSSLLTSVCVRDIEPYKNVVTHGFLLDESGIKMSKSIGNTIVPSTVIKGGPNKVQNPPYGVDLLRTWVASSDYSKDISVGPNILIKILDGIKKIRNTLRFMLASNFDFDPTIHAIPYEKLSSLDKYALHRVFKLQESVTRHYDQFQFQKVHTEIINFSIEISSFYFDVIKRHLYAESPNSHSRRSTQTVLFKILDVINIALAPITVHTSEDVFLHQYQFKNNGKGLDKNLIENSVFAHGWNQLPSQYENELISNQFTNIIAIRDVVNRVLQSMRSQGIIGRSDETIMELTVTNEESSPFYDNLFSINSQLDDIFCVSNVLLKKFNTFEKDLEQQQQQQQPQQQQQQQPQQIEPNSKGEFIFNTIISNNSKQLGRVEVLLKISDKFKCPRCWRHTSIENDKVCKPYSDLIYYEEFFGLKENRKDPIDGNYKTFDAKEIKVDPINSDYKLVLINFKVGILNGKPVRLCDLPKGTKCDYDADHLPDNCTR
ncbi:hypothetical protein ACTFIR_008898 [Dictyostelium discoideum]